MILSNYKTMRSFITSDNYSHYLDADWCVSKNYYIGARDYKGALMPSGSVIVNNANFYMCGCNTGVTLRCTDGNNYSNFAGGAISTAYYYMNNNGTAIAHNTLFGQTGSIYIWPAVVARQTVAPLGRGQYGYCSYYNQYNATTGVDNSYIYGWTSIDASYYVNHAGPTTLSNCRNDGFIDWRVLIGIGTTTPTVNDYEMAVPINGGTQTTTLTYDDYGNAKFMLSYTNTDSDAKSISEVGIGVRLVTTHTAGYIENFSDQYTGTFLLYRAVLDTAVSVASGSTATFTIVWDDDANS